MAEFRTRPDNNYILSAQWNELYVLTEHWKSDVEFYRDELRFLRDLVDKYFMWLVKDENIQTVRELAVKLINTGKEQESLTSAISGHLTHIEELMENAFSHDGNLFREEHVTLENRLAKFVNTMKTLKSEVFSITENMIESEKIQYLLEKQ